MERNDDDKLLIAKIEDRYKFCETRNKIQTTDFLDMRQQTIVEKYIKAKKIANSMFVGGYDEAERKMCAFYPQKLENVKENINWNEYIKVIRISLPNEMVGQYEHRIYLGALMKLGISREKVGDILVDKKGADIIIHPDILKFALNNLPSLTRFSKSKIEETQLENLRKAENKKETTTITIPSMRVDNIVSELAKCSRGKANELLEAERVLVNYEIVQKSSKEIKQGDIVTIRGKGRFEIKAIVGNTRSGRILLDVEKFC